MVGHGIGMHRHWHVCDIEDVIWITASSREGAVLTGYTLTYKGRIIGVEFGVDKESKTNGGH